jgi:branched-chain amino acid transport system substrate-binding protein
MHAMEMLVPLFCSTAQTNDEFIELAGTAGEGVAMPSLKLPVAEQLPEEDPQKEVILQYKEYYESAYGAGTASTFGGHAHDALGMVVRAMELAGPDSAKIREALITLYGLPAFVGVTGVFEMSPGDHNGLSPECMVMVQVQEGALTLIP